VVPPSVSLEVKARAEIIHVEARKILEAGIEKEGNCLYNEVE
jgi:hypothetical protein